MRYRKEQLAAVLVIKKGDVFNPELLDMRLHFSPDGTDIQSLYMNDGDLFYIHPLKFLMSWQCKYFGAIFSGRLRERYDELSAMIPFSKIPHLMIIYGVGFVFVFFLLFFLNRHAYKKRNWLSLNAREILETKSTYRRYFAFGCVGLLSIAIAWISILVGFSLGAILAGVVYNLIWVIVIFEGRRLKREIREDMD